jgi:hypothetical protein
MAEMRDKVKGAIDDTAQQAKNATDKAANAGERTFNAGQQHGHDAAGSVAAVAGQVQDKAKEWAGQAQDKAQEWAGDVTDAAQKYGRQAQHWVNQHTPDSFGDAGQEIVSMVRRYPIPAILIGFGVGLLIGRSART